METPDELPDYPAVKLPARVPWDDKQPMSRKQLVHSFAVHMWYKFDERLPDRDESTAILRKHVFSDDWHANHSMLDRFENPKDRLTLAIIKGLSNAERGELIERIGRWYNEYLSNDPIAKERAQLFSGFRGRIPRLKVELGHPNWHNEPRDTCQHHHFLLHYALANWYGPRKGIRNAVDVTRIAAPYYKFTLPEDRTANLYKYTHRYRDKDGQLYKAVSPWAESLRTDLQGNIDKLVEQFRRSERDTGPAPQSDPDPTAAEAFENLALQPTAPNSYLTPYPPRPQIPTGGLSQVQSQQQYPLVARAPYESQHSQKDDYNDPDHFIAALDQSMGLPNPPPTQEQYLPSVAQLYGVRSPEQSSHQYNIKLPPILDPRYRDDSPAGQHIQPSGAGSSRQMQSEGGIKRKTKSDSPNQPDFSGRDPRRQQPRQLGQSGSLRIDPDAPPPPPPVPSSTSGTNRDSRQDSARKRGRQDRK